MIYLGFNSFENLNLEKKSFHFFLTNDLSNTIRRIIRFMWLKTFVPPSLIRSSLAYFGLDSRCIHVGLHTVRLPRQNMLSELSLNSTSDIQLCLRSFYAITWDNKYVLYIGQYKVIKSVSKNILLTDIYIRFPRILLMNITLEFYAVDTLYFYGYNLGIISFAPSWLQTVI